MVFKHHAYCTFPDFRGISFGSVHYSILSRNGASDKPGAIQAEDEDEEQEQENRDLAHLVAKGLPQPPVAPRGKWQNTVQSMVFAASLYGERYKQVFGSRSNFDLPALDTMIVPLQHDPNAFYYKPHRPSEPQDAFSLKCEQWRHDDGEEEFIGGIHVPRNKDSVKGALVCRIQAANLSTTVTEYIPVRIEITHVRAFESARKMVETLIGTTIIAD